MQLFTKIACALVAWQIACLASAADLQVQVSPVKFQQGRVWVTVFKSANLFLKQPIQNLAARPDGASLVVSFKDLEPGDYAAVVHHDVNDNGKIDRNFLGIPTEPYGFSNDAMGTMGPPSFDQAKFKLVAQGLTLHIKLK